MNLIEPKGKHHESHRPRMDRTKTLTVCLLLLLVAAAVTAAIFFTEPKAQRVTATRKTAMLVEVTRAERGTFRPTLMAMGSVAAEQEIVLSPRVGGEVVERAPGFTPGGSVEKGEVLLRIDPADFENRLRQARSDLREAIAALNIEQGRQDVARQDYRLAGEELAAENRALVLREPQLNTARARVEAARAAVKQAELELQRTTVEAPFAAHVLSREVNVGSQVAAGERLGRLVGLDTYWVVATVPLSRLRWIAFPEAPQGKGSPVRIYNRAAWPEGTWRQGWIESLVGALEEQTRLARVLVTVPDPLALAEGAPDKPPLMIGAYVEVRIEGKRIEEVVRLDRDYVRGGDTVWVMQEGKLEIREVEIVLQDAEYAYIEGGLNEGDLVVTTNLSTVTEGAPLRREGAQPRSDEKPPEEDQGR